MARYTKKKELFHWSKAFLIAVIFAFLVNSFFIVNASVPSGSMETTILTGDRIIALRPYYLFSEPARGDVVIFKYPDDPTQSTLYVKRIIGLPGEKIMIHDGLVYINNRSEPLLEPYLEETPQGTYGPYTVPEGSYFMMGDNRNHSIDARFWTNTFVPSKKILGKVLVSYFPNPRMIQ